MVFFFVLISEFWIFFLTSLYSRSPFCDGTLTSNLIASIGFLLCSRFGGEVATYLLKSKNTM